MCVNKNGEDAEIQACVSVHKSSGMKGSGTAVALGKLLPAKPMMSSMRSVGVDFILILFFSKLLNTYKTTGGLQVCSGEKQC